MTVSVSQTVSSARSGLTAQSKKGIYRTLPQRKQPKEAVSHPGKWLD